MTHRFQDIRQDRSTIAGVRSDRISTIANIARRLCNLCHKVKTKKYQRYSSDFSAIAGTDCILFVIECSPREVGRVLNGETLTASAYEPGYERLLRTTNEPTLPSTRCATATNRMHQAACTLSCRSIQCKRHATDHNKLSPCKLYLHLSACDKLHNLTQE